VPPTLLARADKVIELADIDRAARSGPHGM
jgi:hypothetical protein